MKLIIADEAELSERGTIHVSNREMTKLIDLLEKWGIDFKAFQQSVQRTPSKRGDSARSRAPKLKVSHPAKSR